MGCHTLRKTFSNVSVVVVESTFLRGMASGKWVAMSTSVVATGGSGKGSHYVHGKFVPGGVD